MKFAIVVGCALAGALGTSCGDIHVVPADGGAGKSGGAGGGGGNAVGAAGTGSAGAASTGSAGEGGAACRRELLTNGDFDLGASAWSEAPLGTRLVRKFDDAEVASHQVTPQSGLYVLRLGAPSTNNYVVHYIEQYASIPSGALEVTISGQLQVRTDEPPDDVYDEAYVQLSDEALPASPFFRSAPRWSNLTHASGWTPFSFVVNVASVAGKQLVFRIVAELDTSVPTYFYFDTLSVGVTRCSP